jgi:hypothetical protein
MCIHSGYFWHQSGLQMNILGVITNRGDAMVVGLFVQVVSDLFVFSDQLAWEDHSCADNAVLCTPCGNT